MSTPLPQLSQMTDILDLKEMALWDLRWMWILAGSLLLIVAALVLRSWWHTRSGRRVEAVSPKTPIQAALEALDALVNSRLVESGQGQRFYFRLSEIFREFIEREMGLRALEATVEELRPQLRKSPDLKGEEAGEAVWLLELSDMAKFAKQIPEREDLVKSVKVCRLWMSRVAERRDFQRQATLAAQASEGSA
jgi:hypothetical protein